jgi:hypothetical protein
LYFIFLFESSTNKYQYFRIDFAKDVLQRMEDVELMEKIFTWGSNFQDPSYFTISSTGNSDHALILDVCFCSLPYSLLS